MNAPAVALTDKPAPTQLMGLNIHLHPQAEQPVQIVKNTDIPLAKLLQNRPLIPGITLIGRIFRLCKGAQSTAAQVTAKMALQSLQASHSRTQNTQNQNRQPALQAIKQGHYLRLLRMEALHEHIWLLGIALPRALTAGLTPTSSATDLQISAVITDILKSLRQAIDRLYQHVTQQSNYRYAEEPPTYHVEEERMYDEIRTSLDTSTTNIANLRQQLAALDWQASALSPKLPTAMTAIMDKAAFTDTWQNYDSSAFSRIRSLKHKEDVNESVLVNQNVLLGRFDAIVAEIQMLLTKSGTHSLLAIDACLVPLADPQYTQTLCSVTTARGTLLHRLTLHNDSQRIADYQIVSPTDCHFRSQGAAVRLLNDLCQQPQSDTQLTQRANALVQLLNPCCAYHLHIKAAEHRAKQSDHASLRNKVKEVVNA